MTCFHPYLLPWREAARYFPALLVFLVTGHRAGLPTNPPLLDPYEPNDNFHQATHLGNDAAAKYGYLWPSEDEDWFWFTIPDGGTHRVQVWLDSIPRETKYSLDLFSPEGVPITSSSGTEHTGAYLSLRLATGGAYRVRIGTAAEGNPWDPYRIRALVTPNPSADLQLRMRARSLDRSYPLLIYELFVQNLGPDPATGVRLVNELPPGLVFGGVTWSGGWECSLQDNRLVCRLPGLLGPGESFPPATLRFYRIHHWGQEAEYKARLTSAVFDPNQDNNQVP